MILLRRRAVPGAAVLAVGVACAGGGDVASGDSSAAVDMNQGRPYIVVDTGQTRCYDERREIACPAAGAAFCGQDAQVAGVQPRYADNGDGTITDLNTGLMWQQSPGPKVTYARAVARAVSLRLAGHDDWRLPTIKQLYSIIDFDGVDPSGVTGNDTSGLVPFVDVRYFGFEYGNTLAGERIIDSQFWSSSEYVSTTMNGEPTVFGVNFADGRIKGYPRDRGPRGTSATQFARYVRGNPLYGLNAFVDNGDGTVTDTATGLMWSQDDSDRAYDWRGALAYVAQLELAQRDDWRLPNAKELHSIVDYSRSPDTTDSAAISPVFSCSAITDEGGERNYPFYWTATTHANTSRTPGAFAVYVAFGEALGFMEIPPGSGRRQLLDVHGAGAQRSDPKTGDPTGYPNGNGPQGDVVRIYHYVRAVRDVDTSIATPTPSSTAGPTASATDESTPVPSVTPSSRATPSASVAPTNATTPAARICLPRLVRVAR